MPRLGGSGTDRLQSPLVSGEIVNGLAGDDSLIGGAGADVLIDDTGHDPLQGGLGDVRLITGSGSDHFLLTARPPSVSPRWVSTGVSSSCRISNGSCSIAPASAGYGDGGPFARLLGEEPSPLNALLTAASFLVRA